MKVFWANRSLIFVLVRRQLAMRYAGSVLGLFWSVLAPLLMLTVYTVVFSIVFKARWTGMTGSVEFALMIFCGLIPFYAVMDIMVYSPTLFQNQSMLIKKMIFPMEVLPAVSVITALLHMLMALVLLVAFFLAAGILPGLEVLYLPMVLFPLLFWGLGLAIVFSLIGVFIRDIVHMVQFITSLILFLSPIFYSLDQVPGPLRWVLRLNPMTYMIDWIRSCLMPGSVLPVASFLVVTVAGVLVFCMGFKLLIRYRSEVVDVI